MLCWHRRMKMVGIWIWHMAYEYASRRLADVDLSWGQNEL